MHAMSDFYGLVNILNLSMYFNPNTNETFIKAIQNKKQHDYV